ncbi:uncharacterized protein LOC121760890 [Salvia splendens]|uniref:uncharacterized protein LOC121760890 n=1 Tax=Salvia splendens TaxID=180675 RepID=UPI001C262A2A|nr:uncharacterized protein LOC121760890 [Salvia splendens]
MTIRGLEPLSSTSKSTDSSSTMLEQVLAAMTRMESRLEARIDARLEAQDRGASKAIQLPRPDPEPPSGGLPQCGQYPVYAQASRGAQAGTPRLGIGDPSGSSYAGILPNPNPSMGLNSWVNPNAPRSTAWDPPGSRAESASARQPTAWDNPAARQPGGQFDQPRQFKMHQPRFDGSEAATWISRVQYYFEHLLMPEEHRLHYVIMLFDPPASEWVFNYHENNPQARWTDFLEDVRRRFDPQYFQNFIGLIAKLSQSGSLAEYHTTFETMLNRVRGVPEYILLPIYVEGLQQPVKNQVKHQNPSSVAAAMALAIEYDSCIERPPATSGAPRRPWQNRDQRVMTHPLQQSTLPPSTNQPNRSNQAKGSEYPRLPVVRLTAAERAERSKLGLCWYCPEKWVAGHSCRGRFLVYMGEDLESDEDSEHGQEENRDPPVISADLSHIYALDGRQREDDIELRGVIGDIPVRVLVDTGSSHNFLHPDVAEKLALPLQQIRPFRVYVGNGESLLCSFASIQTRLVIQKHVFLVDLHILPVHGPDVILGRIWLKQMRRVTSDYVDGTLEFSRNGKRVCLKLVPPSAREVSLKTFSSLLQLQGGEELFELIQLPPTESNPATEDGTLALPRELPEEIRSVLVSHGDVFGLPSGMPPRRQFDHKIHILPDAKPINVKPYRYPYFQKNEIEKQVKEMLESGLIRPSQSPFSSPVLLIRKKDGSFRFCIDYRALNAATIPDHFPIPTTDELFDELGAARFFTKLDLRSGYHQIRMSDEDIFKTAFRTHDGHFEFLVMPFGLTNAPSTFQAAMNAIFRPLLRQSVIVFFDDILIYSPSMPAHARHIHEVLSILKAHHFFVKLSKCTFACSTVEYLGHLIADGNLKADPAKIEAMTVWPVPKTVKQL